MKRQFVFDIRRLRHLLPVLAAFLFCVHLTAEPLHSLTHCTTLQGCPVCQVASVGTPLPRTPVVLGPVLTLALYAPYTDTPLSNTPCLPLPVVHGRGPPVA